MTLDYILIIISVMLLGGQFAFQRLYQLKCGTSFRSTLLFNALLGAFGASVVAAVSLVFYSSLPDFTTYSLISAALMAVCTTAYTLLGFAMMKHSGMTLYTVFLMMGGMALPYIYGVALLGEECTVLNLGGLLLIMLGITLANIKGAKGSLKGIVPGILVFIINGMCSIISKTHQIEAVYETVSSLDFTFWTALSKFALCILFIPFLKGSTDTTPRFSAKALICLGAALMFAPASVLQFVAAVNLPATVLYPMVSGGLIIISALIDRIFFKTKISPCALCGIILCFLGTCLFL